MSLLDEIIEYKSKSALREKYLDFITRTSEPLSERWAVFKEAPVEWKNTESWIVHFGIEEKLPGEEISWYDDFYIERRETVDMVDLIDNLQGDVYSIGKQFGYFGPWTQELVNEFMEEILSKNLMSFCFDW